jgi:hypothetical protein
MIRNQNTVAMFLIETIKEHSFIISMMFQSVQLNFHTNLTDEERSLPEEYTMTPKVDAITTISGGKK